MQLLFTRHGESQANLLHVISNRDLPHRLTLRGVEQARALAASLRQRNMRKIYTSPIPRALETAAIVAEGVGPSPIIAPALCEFDCGEMEGRADAAAWQAHRAVLSAWIDAQDYTRSIPPDGESYLQLKDRFLPFIQDLVAENKHAEGDILFISHGAVLLLMLPLLLQNVSREFALQHPLDHCSLVAARLERDALVCSVWADIQFQL